MDEQKIAADRVIMSGILGALWKERHIYTVIRYKEELDGQTIVLDFEYNVGELQPYIYKSTEEKQVNKQNLFLHFLNSLTRVHVCVNVTFNGLRRI